MTGFLKKLAPPPGWRIPVLIISGIFAGLLVFTFFLSRAYSYLSDKPSTCVNCHVMAPQYATWSHSSHRENASCNDCHVPHNNVINKYYFKAKDGLRHATIFTLRREPQVIFIKEEGKEVVQDNCLRCHSDRLLDPMVSLLSAEFQHVRSERPCWDCHREIPHGRVNSLSSVPHARVPFTGSTLPDWLKRRGSEKGK